MATVGTLGNHIFQVSANRALTFSSLKWEGAARYAEHQRHLGDSLLEFTGNAPDNITLEMTFLSALGVDPLGEIDDLRREMRRGKVMSLRVGGEKVGKSRWVIVKVAGTLKEFDGQGRVLTAKATVSLKSYGSR